MVQTKDRCARIESNDDILKTQKIFPAYGGHNSPGCASFINIGKIIVNKKHRPPHQQPVFFIGVIFLKSVKSPK